MNKDYRQLTARVKERINPDNIAIRKALTEELGTISYSDVLTYIRISMAGVESEYTQRSKYAGERVKEHLSKELTDVTFRYQGSVMTNTHIRGYSDIDLLTICSKFYFYDSQGIQSILNNSTQRQFYYPATLEKMQREVNTSPYLDDDLADLRNIRLESERILNVIYDICDTTGPKAIKIKNKNLNREVDIVTANWYDDVKSVINDKGEYRGIQIYNKDTHRKGNPDYPFISISSINHKSSETNGRLKKMIRFLKNIKANSTLEIDLSSFDINAICFDIKTSEYKELPFWGLVYIIYKQIYEICHNQSKADSIVSVDGREEIFKNNNTKLENLRRLLSEVEAIYTDIKTAVIT